MFSKKNIFALALLAGVVGVISAPAMTFATTTVFGDDAIDSDFVASVLAYIPALFSELSLWIAVMVGLPLGFWAVRRLVSLVRLR